MSEPSVEAPRGLALPDPLEGGMGDGGAVAWVLDTLRLRPQGRRLLSSVAVLLLLGGAGLFAFPLFSDLYTNQVLQERLEDEFESFSTAPTFEADQVERPRVGPTDFGPTYEPATLTDGDPLTRIVIPRIGISTIVVKGTSQAALRAGAGHYPTSPLPGEPGNVAIAGHRTTYGKPFNRLDQVQVGDEVRLETPVASYVYRVTPALGNGCANGACWVTGPTDLGVVSSTPGSMLTLTTCHPKGSARQRLILRAELVETLPPPA